MITQPLTLSNHLKFYRTINELNQRELGEMVGLHRSTIAHLEQGDNNPSYELAIRLSRLFGIAVTELFFPVDAVPEKRVVYIEKG